MKEIRSRGPQMDIRTISNINNSVRGVLLISQDDKFHYIVRILSVDDSSGGIKINEGWIDSHFMYAPDEREKKLSKFDGWNGVNGANFTVNALSNKERFDIFFVKRSTFGSAIKKILEVEEFSDTHRLFYKKDRELAREDCIKAFNL